MAMPDPAPFCRIGAAAREVGVAAHTLRYWETEFAIRPERSKSGHRVYSRAQVEQMKQIRTLLHEKRFTIEGARKALHGEASATELARRANAYAAKQIDLILANRDRLCAAWIAETGLLPSQSRLVEQVNADGSVSVHIEKLEDENA